MASAQTREFLALVRRTQSASSIRIDGLASGGSDFQNSSLDGRDFSTGLSAALELDIWGRLRKATEASAARASASAAASDTLRLNLEAQAVSAYYQIQSLDSQVGAINKAVSKLKAHARIVDKKVEAGLLGSFESYRIEFAISSLEAESSQLATERGRLENGLAVILGVNPSSYRVPKRGITQSPPPIATNLPSTLLERRPDIIEARALLQASEADIGVAWADFFPRINLLGLVGFGSGRLSNLFDRGANSSIGADALGPVLDGGGRRANYAATQARRDAVLAQAEATTLRAFEDTENALSDLTHLRDEYNARKKAALNAAKTVEGVRKRYDYGVDSLFQLISVEIQVSEEERDQYRARGLQFVATANLIRALGGDWRP